MGRPNCTVNRAGSNRVHRSAMTVHRCVRRGWVLGSLLLAACAALPNQTASPAASPTLMANATVPSAPTGEPVEGTPVRASADDGDFELTLRSAQDRYRAGQSIEIDAVLVYRNGTERPYVAYGDGTGVLDFALRSEDGSVDILPVGFSDCAPHELDRTQRFEFHRSGGWSDESPPFVRSYFDSDDVLRLPSGTWTVSVVASVNLVEGCVDDAHTLTAEIPITVVP
jgi:hypothetical protein